MFDFLSSNSFSGFTSPSFVIPRIVLFHCQCVLLVLILKSSVEDKVSALFVNLFPSNFHNCDESERDHKETVIISIITTFQLAGYYIKPLKPCVVGFFKLLGVLSAKSI